MTVIMKLLVMTIILAQATCSFSQSKATVRFDGFYQTVSEIDSTDNDTTYSFLRFYPDGKVLSVGASGTVNDLKSWFNLKQENPSVGIYEINGARIYFTTTSKEGTVVYDGQVTDKYYLDLSTKSLINGYVSHEKYYFIKVIGLK